MKALQMHYTSCRRGSSGHPGFQTRTKSAGIAPDEQRELERRGLYLPPRSANPEPDAAAIERDFPKAFRFCALDSGRKALVRSCYTGRDYSGRWGNYFAHSLIFGSEGLNSRWPIDLYEWPEWREGLSAKEDGEDIPAPLEPVDCSGIKAAESFQLGELQAFLADSPGRTEILTRMVRAVFLGLENSRVLVIRDELIEGLYWIACLHKLFSPRHAQELSFSTYQFDRNGCATLNATTADTGFAFSEVERRHQFYMFDLLTGQHSSVPEAEGDYAAFTARWMAEDPERLLRFFAFLEHFEHRQVSSELLAALHLFELSSGNRIELDGEELRSMVHFAARYGDHRGGTPPAAVMDAMVEALAPLGALPQPEDYEVLLSFLAEGSRGTGTSKHREATFATFGSLLLEHLVCGRGISIVQTSWRLVRETLPQHTGELARHLLSPPFQGPLQARLASSRPEALLVLVRVVWWSLEQVGRQPPWQQEELRQLVEALLAGSEALEEKIQGLLDTIPPRGNALGEVARLAASVAQTHAAGEKGEEIELSVGRAIARVLAEVLEAVAEQTRCHLEEQGDSAILFGEWLEIVATSGDPRGTWESYCEHVLDKLPRYAASHRSRIAAALLDHLSKPAGQALALDWLKSREIDAFEASLARRCLDLANGAVPLEPNSREASGIARLVREGAERLDLPLAPDHPLLLKILQEVEKTRLDRPRLQAVAQALQRIEATEYRIFLDGFLPAAFDSGRSRQDHGQMLVACRCPDHLEIFRKGYEEVWKAQGRGKWSRSLQAALDFWLHFEPRSSRERSLRALESKAHDALASILSRVATEHLGRIHGQLELEGIGAERWRELEILIERKKNSPWRRLVRFVSGKRSSYSTEETNQVKIKEKNRVK